MKEKQVHVRALASETLIVSILMAAFSAVICMQIIARIGITPNTSIVGAIIAMALARVPIPALSRFRSLERQNLVQTMASAGGFGAANCFLLSVTILYLLGKPELVFPMLIGSLIALVFDIWLVYRIYDSELFPALYAWPPGVATAEAIIAGDVGGKRARRLLEGVVAGIIGTHFKLPMAGVGIVFIANIYAMTALGIGLILRGYSMQIFGMDLGKTYIPHGVMIGAGIVSLIQAIVIILRGRKKERERLAAGGSEASSSPEAAEAAWVPTTSSRMVERSMGQAFLFFLIGAAILALVGGAIAEMTVGKLIVWLIYAAFAALTSTILVGLCAMHSGWFPAFAITVIYLTIGIFMGFPAAPLALLTGFTASTGPLFADMGYDLKTGWLLRGKGKNLEFELDGRRQQFYAELLGGVVAMMMVYLFMGMHFKLDLLPPISRVYATTIKAGADPAIVRQLILWAIPGLLLQAIGGPGRALGILFATGLLIRSPIYGIGVLVAVVVRLIIGTKPMEVREAGLIAGDGIYGFVSSAIRTFFV